MEVNLKLILFIILLIGLSAISDIPKLPKDRMVLDREYVEKLIRPYKRKHEKRIIYCIQLFAYTYGHDAKMFARLIKFESLFDRLAISSKGARGLTQLMPVWKKELKHCRNGKFKDYMKNHPDKTYKDYFEYIGISLEIGARALREYKNKYGTYELALVRYNMKEKAFRKVLNNPESAKKYKYVRNILEIND